MLRIYDQKEIKKKRRQKDCGGGFLVWSWSEIRPKNWSWSARKKKKPNKKQKKSIDSY
jgi:hypothetical protein